MNFIVVFVVGAISVAYVHCEDLYSSKFDNIDIDAIMKNDRLLQKHFECIIDGKGCTAEADELRKHIPDIMETCCGKCTDKQKEGAKKMSNYLIENKPDIVKKLLDKFDPERKYINKCNDQLKSGGIDTTKLQ